MSKKPLNNHQLTSKSNLIVQNAIACNPEVKVSTKDTKAHFSHLLLFFLLKKIAVNPVKEMHKSKGKKDQFQSTIIGLL